MESEEESGSTDGTRRACTCLAEEQVEVGSERSGAAARGFQSSPGVREGSSEHSGGSEGGRGVRAWTQVQWAMQWARRDARGTDGGGATGRTGTASPGLHPAGIGMGSPGFQSSGMIGMGGVVMPPAAVAGSVAASVLAAARALAFAVAASCALQQREL